MPKLDYWTTLTMQKCIELKVTTKRETKVDLVENYGFTPDQAKQLVKGW